jgi:dipeptidyl aminopeptidase/acylaminoacyl peptidase
MLVGALARGAGAALLALKGLAGSVPAAAAIPAQLFAAGAQMEAPHISPDGTRLVYLSTVGGVRYVMLRDLRSGELHPLLRGGGATFRATRCAFKSETRLLCHFQGVLHASGMHPFPASRLVALNADGSGARVLFQNAVINARPVAFAQYQDRIVAWLPNDPHHVLIELATQDGLFPSVFRLDVDSGNLQLVVREHPPVIDWIADHQGVVRFGYGFRSGEAIYVARNGPWDSWRTIEQFKRFERSHFDPLAFGSLPNRLYVLAPQAQRAAIWEMDLAASHDMQLVFSRPEVDVDALIEWPTDWHVAGFQYQTDRPYIFYIDPEARAVEAALERAFSGTYHRVVDATPDGSRLIVMSSSDVLPPRYDLMVTATHALTALGAENPDLSPDELAPMQPITVPGPDGIRIPGYLTLPRGASPRQPLPAVVFPHGGPHARDSWGYDPLLQFLASRGYAVLQLNFRGSSGFGQQWEEAGRHAWGTVMNDDITAGARWLISQGIADPARLCIVGWSYGGYAALVGVIKQPQLYRCAVSIAGVSDLSQLARDASRFYGDKDALLESTGSDTAELKAESPLLHADRIRVPVLLVHGENDTTVLAGQSREMAKALAASYVPHELLLIPEGEHSLLRPDMRLALYQKLETFLGQNLHKP